MPRRKTTVAPRRLVRPREAVPGIESPLAHWLLRRLSLYGYAVPGRETFDAAVSAGVAKDDLQVAEMLVALEREGLAVCQKGIFLLTETGSVRAAAACRRARALGEPPIAIPERYLPRVFLGDEDCE